MKVKAYIHSLKDRVHDRNVLGEAEIIEKIGDNLYRRSTAFGARRSSTSSPGPSTWMTCTGFVVELTAMDEILAALFHCDYSFDRSRETAEQYSVALD